MPWTDRGFVPTDYDKDHVRDILRGEGNWFGTLLLRLINHSDSGNLATLREAYPEHVAIYEEAMGLSSEPPSSPDEEEEILEDDEGDEY